MTDIQSQRLSRTADDDQLPHAPLMAQKPIPITIVTVLEPSDFSSISQVSDEETVDTASRRRSSAFSKLTFTDQTGWGYEVLALLLSLSAFVVLIVVLKYYDGRPQKEWQYSHLTLNGLVALLSTICRAALLIPVAAALSQGKWLWYSRGTTGKPLDDLAIFDEASRGALGSVRLLWRIKGRHLVSFGALLTILSLAFDTFSQQVVSVDFLNIIDTSPSAAANVPRSEVYNRTLKSTSGNVSLADLEMQASIFTGFLSKDIPELPAYCSTGNCTWPIIPTLGICADCSDVTSDLTYDCNSTHCTYSLPSGNSITGASFVSSSVAQGTFFSIKAAPGSVYKSGPDTPRYVVHTEAIGVPYQAPAVLNPNTSHVSATECALWLCVQAFNVSVTDGRQFQQTVGTWSKTGTGNDLKFVDIPSEFNVAPNVSFAFSGPAYQGLSLVIYNLFKNPMSVSPGEEQNWYGHAGVQAFWEGSQDWKKYVDKIALKLTNNIRSTSPADNTTTAQSEYYAGKTYTTASFIHVRWPWLAFPALMVVASVLFLLLSIWETRRSRVNGWKANPLPLLFTDVDEELVRKAEGAMSLADFKGAVGSERALLERDTVGRWHFRRPMGR